MIIDIPSKQKKKSNSLQPLKRFLRRANFWCLHIQLVEEEKPVLATKHWKIFPSGLECFKSEFIINEKISKFRSNLIKQIIKYS